MPLEFVQVDAFSDTAFRGNPAAVCRLERFADDATLQQIAREMNLSETAFLVARDYAGVYDLRWFTPNTEVDLCGHATLAAAHVLWQSGVNAPTLTFHTRGGVLSVRQNGGWLTMDFPALPVEEEEAPDDAEQMIGSPIRYWAENGMDMLAEISSADALRTLRPKLDWISALPARGLIVTAASDDPEYDFMSRFFAPQCDVPEDPVTGSAHCALAPYWAKKLGRNCLVGFQASQRGGVVRVEIADDRVLVSGQAVTVARGELLVDLE